MRDEVKSGKPVTETIEQYRREHPGALERAEAEILAEEAANAEIIPFVQSTKATEGEAKRIAVVQACTALGMTICGVCNKQTAQLEEGGWVSTLCDCALAEIEHLRGELHIVAKFLRDCGYSSTKEGEQIEELYQRIRKYEVC